jgi:hypothetical protein
VLLTALPGCASPLTPVREALPASDGPSHERRRAHARGDRKLGACAFLDGARVVALPGHESQVMQCICFAFSMTCSAI